MRILIAIALCLFASLAQAATNVARLTAVVEGYTGTTSTAPQINRIVTRLLPLAQGQITSDGKNIATLTNEEKAGYVLGVMKANTRDLIRAQAQRQEQAAVQPTVDTNTGTAAADLQ